MWGSVARRSRRAAPPSEVVLVVDVEALVSLGEEVRACAPHACRSPRRPSSTRSRARCSGRRRWAAPVLLGVPRDVEVGLVEQGPHGSPTSSSTHTFPECCFDQLDGADLVRLRGREELLEPAANGAGRRRGWWPGRSRTARSAPRAAAASRRSTRCRAEVAGRVLRRPEERHVRPVPPCDLRDRLSLLVETTTRPKRSRSGAPSRSRTRAAGCPASCLYPFLGTRSEPALAPMSATASASRLLGGARRASAS